LQPSIFSRGDAKPEKKDQEKVSKNKTTREKRMGKGRVLRTGKSVTILALLVE